MSKGDSKPIGTKVANYAGPDAGPFRCDRCVHYLMTQGKSLCDHKDMLEDPEVEKEEVKNKRYAKVAPGGCCTYFRNIPLGDIPFVKIGL